MDRAVLGDSVYYGTSSWSEKSWKGVFYPDDVKPAEMLPIYASNFRSVEADVTYYRVPGERMIRGWFERTPEDFMLSAKFPRSVVHAGDGKTPDGEKLLSSEEAQRDTEFFLDVMRLMKHKCGPLVLQFPYFNKSVFPSPEPFLERLDPFLSRLPQEFRYAVEIRNRQWLDSELPAILSSHHACLVMTDLTYMPRPEALVGKPELITTDFLYLRLIGDRRAVEERTSTFDRIVVDRSERLAQWAGLFEPLISVSEAAFLYANNHFAGHGPDTIRQLVEMLRGS